MTAREPGEPKREMPPRVYWVNSDRMWRTPGYDTSHAETAAHDDRRRGTKKVDSEVVQVVKLTEHEASLSALREELEKLKADPRRDIKSYVEWLANENKALQAQLAEALATEKEKP